MVIVKEFYIFEHLTMFCQGVELTLVSNVKISREETAFLCQYKYSKLALEINPRSAI